jgi:iron complex outermembrane recepter protein
MFKALWRNSASAAVLLCAAGWGGAAAAQTAPQAQAERPKVETIIVTAQRRESALQITPIAITALSANALERRSVDDVQGLATVATGLTYNKVSNFVQLSIRGISLEQINLGGEPGVAFHIDGVPIARPFAADAILSDLSRVEVLRGPQGTLYGRNATGGSVNLISNQPSRDFSASVTALVGDYNRRRGEVVLNGPLSASGGVQGRLSLVADSRDGYITNLNDGRDLDDGGTISGRGSLGFDISPQTRLVVSADVTRTRDTGPIFDVGSIPGTAPALGGRVTADPRTIRIDGPADNDFDASGVSARLTHDTDAVTVTGLVAWRDTSFRLRSDLDGTDFFLINEDLRESATQWSGELQIASKGAGKLEWMVGLFAFQEEGTLNYAFPIPLFGTTITFDASQDTSAYAVFGQASYAFTEKLRGTLGLRYSYEEKSGRTRQVLFVPNAVSLSDSWTAFTPKFGLDYQFNDDVFGYVSIARGFKAGGLNTTSLQVDAYDPEFIWSGEVGLKTRGLDGRLQANLAVFYYEYSDLQVNQFAVGQSFIANAAAATGKGAEIEVIGRPGEGWTLEASVALLDATFSDFKTVDTFRPTLGTLNLEGNELPRAPGASVNLAVQRDIDFAGGAQLSLRVDYAHKSKFFFTPFNTDYAQSPASDVVNARVSWTSPDKAWRAALFGRNLTDEVIPQTVTVSGINAGTIVLYAPPRTWGFELKRLF